MSDRPNPEDWPQLDGLTNLRPGDLFAYEDPLGIERAFEITIIVPETEGVGLRQVSVASLEAETTFRTSNYVEADLDVVRNAIESESGRLVQADEADYDSYWDGRYVVYE